MRFMNFLNLSRGAALKLVEGRIWPAGRGLPICALGTTASLYYVTVSDCGYSCQRCFCVNIFSVPEFQHILIWLLPRSWMRSHTQLCPLNSSRLHTFFPLKGNYPERFSVVKGSTCSSGLHVRNTFFLMEEK